MIIIGAGMAGLLAGGMIRNQKVTIYEAAENLPNNHSAVLRFRSNAVGEFLGIEFKRVKMIKCTEKWKNPVADSLAYSLKCNGSATLRSIISADATEQFRYIAPPNLIEQMRERVNGEIVFGRKVQFDEIKKCGTPIISTMPMNILMDILKFPDKPNFDFVHGVNVNATLSNVDANVSVYIPNPSHKFNRISLTGNRLTVEFSHPRSSFEDVKSLCDGLRKNKKQIENIVEVAASTLGIDWPEIEECSASMQKYSKILPITENERKNFIVWASENFGVYSLGRFATWRPGLLLDDLVNDVNVIQRIIKHGNYDQRKKG